MPRAHSGALGLLYIQVLPYLSVTVSSPPADTTAGAFHWIEPRKLTLGELKRIMSLPDDFKLTGKWNQKAERCGRMVPPIMMERIASAVYTNVLEKYNG